MAVVSICITFLTWVSFVIIDYLTNYFDYLFRPFYLSVCHNSIWHFIKLFRVFAFFVLFVPYCLGIAFNMAVLYSYLVDLLCISTHMCYLLGFFIHISDRLLLLNQTLFMLFSLILRSQSLKLRILLKFCSFANNYYRNVCSSFGVINLFACPIVALSRSWEFHLGSLTLPSSPFLSVRHSRTIIRNAFPNCRHQFVVLPVYDFQFLFLLLKAFFSLYIIIIYMKFN